MPNVRCLNDIVYAFIKYMKYTLEFFSQLFLYDTTLYLG